MTQRAPFEIEPPRPSVRAMQERLATELSVPRRIGLTLLLIAALVVGIGVFSLWLTEPGLPLRTHLGFACIVAVAAAWASVAGWTLARRRVLLGRHRLITSRIAVAASLAFTLGALALAAAEPELRRAGLLAGLLGAVMSTAALLLWRRAAAGYRELVARAARLEVELRPGAATRLLLPLLLATSPLPVPTAEAQQLTVAPLEMVVPAPPTPVAALGRQHLVYEVHLTSFAAGALSLDEIAVLDAASGEAIGSWRGDELARRAHVVGAPADAGAPRHLVPGQRAIVFLWLTVAPGEAPDEIRHRVTATVPPAGPQETVEGARAVVGSPASAVSPPVGAGRWVALRGPSNTSGHRRSVVALDGAVRLPQRFAVDWARLGDDGRLFRGTGDSNADWHSFGEPVLAARGGRVVRVVGDRPDHPPRQGVAAHFDRHSATGNTVVVDEGDGRFAVYAHLRQGSLAVAGGQEVSAGTPLGAIGNSGHSLAPHLHFHVGTAAEPLAAEGLPFTLTGYRLLGRLDSFAAAVEGAAWQPDPRRPARPVAGEMPLENMVVEITAPAGTDAGAAEP